MHPESDADIAIIGAGAAGLAAAIFAGEANRDRVSRILLLEGARKPGAKILVSGGGRCNVTNERVTPEDFCGGPRPLIRNVLRAFDEQQAARWMKDLGVPLKTEAGGKMFPVADSARVVLDALLNRVAKVGVELQTGVRIADVQPDNRGFTIRLGGPGGTLHARRVIVATGGLSLPKSGSDGAGLDWMRRLGHSIVPTTPALVPLELRPGPTPAGLFAEFAGITMDATLVLATPEGKRLAECSGSLVFTHFGISGPAPMDLSRHIGRFRLEHPLDTPIVTIGHPMFRSFEQADQWLQDATRTTPGRQAATVLSELLPERFARAIAGSSDRLCDLTREKRTALARALFGLEIDVCGDRGYAFAETTAGGVNLREVDPRTMESRIIPGMHLCGEMLDVDGRIGGFNFQWAWATGYLAGRAAVRLLAGSSGTS
jgi:hypothetical protein